MSNWHHGNRWFVVLLYCAVSTILHRSSNAQQFSDKQIKVDSQNELTIKDPILREFILGATAPNLGVNGVSMYRTPMSTVFLCLNCAWEHAELATALNLNQTQLDAFDLAWNEIHKKKGIGSRDDESIEWPGVYSSLTEEQLRTLELVAVTVDGACALTRSFFVKELDLQEEQVSNIKKYITNLQSTEVKKRFQQNFGGPSDSTVFGQIDGWQQAMVAIKCNQDVIVMLTTEQQAKLSHLLTEAQSHQELKHLFINAYFFHKRNRVN